MNTAVASKAELIRTINDRCRSHFLGCQVMVTPSVQGLSDDEKAQLLQAVRTFDTFDVDNDPHREHDFGASQHRSRTCRRRSGLTKNPKKSQVGLEPAAIWTVY